MNDDRCTHPDRGATVNVRCPKCGTDITLPADSVDAATDRFCPVCDAQVPFLPAVPPGGNRRPREAGERGPFDSEFEKGYVPMDEPPGMEEREYKRWKAAGGQVVYEPCPIEGKYGTVTTSKGTFHPGEPVFIIRATDNNAVGAVMDYATRCMTAGCSSEHCSAVVLRALRIRDWQQANPTLVKKPD